MGATGGAPAARAGARAGAEGRRGIAESCRAAGGAIVAMIQAALSHYSGEKREAGMLLSRCTTRFTSASLAPYSHRARTDQQLEQLF
jgi:hypothetical protein